MTFKTYFITDNNKSIELKEKFLSIGKDDRNTKHL